MNDQTFEEIYSALLIGRLSLILKSWPCFLRTWKSASVPEMRVIKFLLCSISGMSGGYVVHNAFWWFFDFSKAFDRVNNKALFGTLR